jgi:hypothetical protein
MQPYRFLGLDSNVGPKRLKQFGEQVELSPEVAAVVMSKNAHCPMLPEEEFWAQGFTEDELRKYAQPWTHNTADPAFLAKKRAALQRYAELAQ